MPPAARISDKWVGKCKVCKCSVTGIIVAGSGNRFIEGSPQSRIGDTVIAGCGHSGVIVSGSPTVSTNGIPVARVGDKIEGVVSGVIVSGATSTIIN